MINSSIENIVPILSVAIDSATSLGWDFLLVVLTLKKELHIALITEFFTKYQQIFYRVDRLFEAYRT